MVRHGRRRRDPIPALEADRQTAAGPQDPGLLSPDSGSQSRGRVSATTEPTTLCCAGWRPPRPSRLTPVKRGARWCWPPPERQTNRAACCGGRVRSPFATRRDRPARSRSISRPCARRPVTVRRSRGADTYARLAKQAREHGRLSGSRRACRAGPLRANGDLTGVSSVHSGMAVGYDCHLSRTAQPKDAQGGGAVRCPRCPPWER